MTFVSVICFGCGSSEVRLQGYLRVSCCRHIRFQRHGEHTKGSFPYASGYLTTGAEGEGARCMVRSLVLATGYLHAQGETPGGSSGANGGYGTNSISPVG